MLSFKQKNPEFVLKESSPFSESTICQYKFETRTFIKNT